MGKEEQLEEIRGEISKTTIEIIRLVASRNNLVKRAGQLKLRDSIPLEDRTVERALIRKVADECERLDVDRKLGRKLIRILLSESKRLQRMQAKSAIAGRKNSKRGPSRPIVAIELTRKVNS
jgi:chorismate mutase